jgi:hypothetical protein
MEESEATLTGKYHIRVRKGDWEVEVSAPEKDFVLNESGHLMDLLSKQIEPTNVHEAEIVQDVLSVFPEIGQLRNVKPQTLNEFFRQFKLQTHLEKILVLGYWCEVKQRQPQFTLDDIITRYKEVKEPPPANVRRDLGSLVAKGFLLSNGKSVDGTTYELTNTGIKEVETKLLSS